MSLRRKLKRTQKMVTKKIYLKGYFDYNFGDDIMLKLVARSFPDYSFFIEDVGRTLIFQEKNIFLASKKECERYPSIVVTGSGFMIGNRVKLRIEIMRYLRRENPGDYCFGCNIEPLDNPVKRFLISRKLNKFRLITCRDKYSYEWISTYAKHTKVHLLPDILFSLPDDMIPQKSGEELLGIAVMHRRGDSADSEYYHAMASAADLWVKTTGKKVLLMALDSGNEDDVWACYLVKDKMSFSEKAEIVIHRDGTEIPAALSRCEKVICARFHSIVLALRMGLPFYPLIFREKARNLLKDIEYPFSKSDIDNIDLEGLSAFVTERQPTFHLDNNIYEHAKDYVQLFKNTLGESQN